MAFSLSDYEILGEIGRGGFSSVLKARQKSLGRLVAIKALSSQRSLDQHEILRFRREAEAMALLSHDNIVAVLDFACSGNNYYIVMEYINGMTLESALGAGIPVMPALLIMELAINGLKTAHAHSIIHRDIKPGNILLGTQGQVKLADFGLASLPVDMSRQTSGSAVLGTFCFMAPEAMVNPREVDHRIDIFSVGCVLYRILAGKLPFPGANPAEVSYKVLNEEPEPVQCDRALQPLADLTLRCLAKEREQRPGLEQIMTPLQNVLADSYHTTREMVRQFINAQNSAPAAGEPGRASVPVHLRKSNNLMQLAIALSAGLCVILVCSYLVLNVKSIRRGQTLPALLPPDAVGSIRMRDEQAPRAEHQMRKKSHDNPVPVTSTAPDAAPGSVMIEGLRPDDSVTVNGETADIRKVLGKQKIVLGSGSYDIVIYRRNGSYISRTVRVMPYQVLIIDIENERIRGVSKR